MGKRKLTKKSCFKYNKWHIVEDRFTSKQNLHKESVFSLGNGYMAMRGTFEESFSAGNTKPTTYIAGVFDLWKFNTMIMKGKNMCPPYNNNMLSFPDLFNIELYIGNDSFDMSRSRFKGYRRTLNLKEGILNRKLIWIDKSKKETEINIDRIVCMDDYHIAAVNYSIKPLNYSGQMSIEISLGKDKYPRSEKWREIKKKTLGKHGAYVVLETEYSGITVATAMDLRVTSDGEEINYRSHSQYGDGCIKKILKFNVRKGIEYTLEKTVSLCTSRDRNRRKERVEKRAVTELRKAAKKHFRGLLESHTAAWEKFWQDNDITVDGDISIQQGIRFCLFQLHQAYRGDDPGVNIGCKGLASAGPYFWDTEIYLLPFYIYTDTKSAKNLMLYRYYTLDKARNIAELWGYSGAKYPWMTINGDDISIPFWECTIGEIHINAAVSYGIWHYVEASGDKDFLVGYGAEILIEASRFWASRIEYNSHKKRYVINQVTGPDEYMPMVNNNCYTNAMVQWNLEYTCRVVEIMKKRHSKNWRKLCRKIDFRDEEIKKWKDIIKKIYIPFDKKLNIHPQDDTFLALDNIAPSDVPDKDRPLEINWPFEKVMRYNILKQPDVVLLMYLLNDHYSPKIKKSNYDFYEPKTIHDSSLSPCIHSIMASEIERNEDAYYYLWRSVRLDLDNYNNNTESGIHTASTGGAWMTFVNGFGGMRLRQGQLYFSPRIPKRWRKYSFNMKFKDRIIGVEVKKNKAMFYLKKGNPLNIRVKNNNLLLKKEKKSFVRI